MDQVKKVVHTSVEDVQHYIDVLKQKIPTNLEELQPHIDYAKSITVDEIVNDFKNLRLNPLTVSLTLFSVATIIVLNKLVYGASKVAGGGRKNGRNSNHNGSSTGTNDGSKHKKKSGKKKLSKAQRANREIQEILDFVELEYVPEIDKYIEDYKTLSADDAEFKFNYFEEMLLKETMRLDGIDVNGNEILRENRKKVIKFIQDHQKRLDKFKKDIANTSNVTQTP